MSAPDTEFLHDAVSRLPRILAHAPIVVFAIDRAGVFTLSEGGGLAALGLEPGQVVGANAFEIYRDVPWIVDNLRRALLGEEFTATGEVAGLWYQSHYAPVRHPDGRVAGLIGVATDITEAKRAAAEIKKEHEFSTAVLLAERSARAEAEEARRGILLLHRASDAFLAAPLDVNATLGIVAHLAVPELADWSVVDAAEPDGSIRRIAVVHADPAKAELAAALALHSPDATAPEGVPKVIRTGRSEFYATLTDAALAVRDGEWPMVGFRDPEALRLIRALGIRSYLTVPLVARGRTLGALTLVAAGEERRFGESERAVAEDLAQRAALAVDNARLYEGAREALRARDEFNSIASHELRTPVTSLQLAVQTLLRAWKPDAQRTIPPVVAVSLLQTAERQVKRLAKLVDMLLDVTRVQAGRLDLDLVEVDLAQVTREVAAHFAEDLAFADCRLALGADLAVVGRWDRSRIEQVVTNLLSNAIKYGAGQPIDVTVEADESTARFTVTDRGIGIAPDVQARIFERFERAVSARHYGGLGLGLYIVRRIVDAHGGAVRVTSVPGAGSTFVVELPRAGPPPGRNTGSLTPPPVSGGGGAAT